MPTWRTLRGDNRAEAPPARSFGSPIDPNDRWWDNERGRYETFLSEDSSFHRGEGMPFLWFGAADWGASMPPCATSRARMERREHVGLPALFYRLGIWRLRPTVPYAPARCRAV